MTYKITKNRFDIQNGTASVTAHITYIDGTNIYKATITEFLRQDRFQRLCRKQAYRRRDTGKTCFYSE